MAARLTGFLVVLIVAATVIAGLIVGAQRDDESGPVDLLVYNGRVFTADGRANLTATMGNFKTPFNVIVGSTLSMTAGQPIPQGRLDAVIKIRAHAGL